MRGRGVRDEREGEEGVREGVGREKEEKKSLKSAGLTCTNIHTHMYNTNTTAVRYTVLTISFS